MEQRSRCGFPRLGRRHHQIGSDLLKGHGTDPFYVEKILELELSADEKAMLAKSATSVQGIVDVVNKSV